MTDDILVTVNASNLVDLYSISRSKECWIDREYCGKCGRFRATHISNDRSQLQLQPPSALVQLPPTYGLISVLLPD